MSYPSDDLRWGTAPQHFCRHLVVMPGWHKGVLFLSLVLGIIGGTGWYMNKTAAKPPIGSSHVPAPDTSHPHRSSGSSSDAPAAQADSKTASGGKTWNGMLANLSSPSMKIGISVLAGFILGWIFRAFLKTMAFFALILFGLFAALSYFGVLNVDMTAAKEKYATAMQWATDQFWRVKDMLVAHLPSSSGGTVGAFLGFRRR